MQRQGNFVKNRPFFWVCMCECSSTVKIFSPVFFKDIFGALVLLFLTGQLKDWTGNGGARGYDMQQRATGWNRTQGRCSEDNLCILRARSTTAPFPVFYVIINSSDKTSNLSKSTLIPALCRNNQTVAKEADTEICWRTSELDRWGKTENLKLKLLKSYSWRQKGDMLARGRPDNICSDIFYFPFWVIFSVKCLTVEEQGQSKDRCCGIKYQVCWVKVQDRVVSQASFTHAS